MTYIVSRVEKEYAIVNGERIEIDPSFESVPDKDEYEAWLNGAMTDAVKAIRGRDEVQTFKNNLAQMAQGRSAD